VWREGLFRGVLDWKMSKWGLALDSPDAEPQIFNLSLGPVRAGLSGTRDRLVAVEVKCVSC
jgi:hypothetical protein